MELAAFQVWEEIIWLDGVINVTPRCKLHKKLVLYKMYLQNFTLELGYFWTDGITKNESSVYR